MSDSHEETIKGKLSSIVSVTDTHNVEIVLKYLKKHGLLKTWAALPDDDFKKQYNNKLVDIFSEHKQSRFVAIGAILSAIVIFIVGVVIAILYSLISKRKSTVIIPSPTRLITTN